MNKELQVATKKYALIYLFSERKQIKLDLYYRLSDGTRNRALDKDKIAELSHKLSSIGSEIQFYQRRITGVDEEIKRIKHENNGLVTELQRSRTVSFLKLKNRFIGIM